MLVEPRGGALPVPEGERLHKALARTGIGSRRQIEAWIAAGRVFVNGHRARVGDRIERGDSVSIDGRRVSLAQDREVRVLLYHKPVGQVCTRSDPQGRPTVFERLPPLRSGRWISVGRLDVTTQGILLFTNHGELAHRLTHPSGQLQREYAVRVLGRVTRDQIAVLTRGVELDGVVSRFAAVDAAGGEGANHWYRVVLDRGRNREVHRLWESQGIQVSRLIRVRYGPVALPRELAAGRWRALERAECLELARSVGFDQRAFETRPARRRRASPRLRR